METSSRAVQVRRREEVPGPLLLLPRLRLSQEQRLPEGPPGGRRLFSFRRPAAPPRRFSAHGRGETAGAGAGSTPAEPQGSSPPPCARRTLPAAPPVSTPTPDKAGSSRSEETPPAAPRSPAPRVKRAGRSVAPGEASEGAERGEVTAGRCLPGGRERSSSRTAQVARRRGKDRSVRSSPVGVTAVPLLLLLLLLFT